MRIHMVEYKDDERRLWFNPYNCESWWIDQKTAAQHELDGTTDIIVYVNTISGYQEELSFKSYIAAEFFCGQLAGFDD